MDRSGGAVGNRNVEEYLLIDPGGSENGKN